MSRTYRRGKFSNNLKDGYDLPGFWYKHDSAFDRRMLNRKFRREEKQYFRKFYDVKYNQKPKSRGWKTW